MTRHSAETNKMLCECSAEIQTQPKEESEEQSRAVRSNKNISIKSGVGVDEKGKAQKLTWHSAETKKILCGYSAEIQSRPRDEREEQSRASRSNKIQERRERNNG